MNEIKKYTEDLNVIKKFLNSHGWKIMKTPENSAEDFCAQGVIYMNFCKDGMGLRLEYGDKGCVLNETDE